MRFRIYLLFVLLMSCGVSVNYDYEKNTDFNNYKTYRFFDDMNTGLSDLDTKRFIKAIKSNLNGLGIEYTNEKPDFYIDIQIKEIESPNTSNLGVGLGGVGGNLGGGLSVGIPIGNTQKHREILIEFVDINKNEKLFWQSTSTSTYNPKHSPEKREHYFYKIASAMFKKYPPK